MRKTLLAFTLATGLTSSLVYANQATLDALAATGLVLTPDQVSLFESAENDSTAMLDAISNVIPSVCSDEESITSFITAVVSANPSLSDEIFQLASMGCPDMIASIAEAILEAEAPAAGIEATDSAPALAAVAGDGIGAPRSPSAGGAPSSPN